MINEDQMFNEVLKNGFVPADEKQSLISFDSSDGDEIEYICLFQFDGDYTDDGPTRTWVKVTGRQNVFDFLKDVIINIGIINTGYSYIMTTNSKVSDSMTVYNFMKKMAVEGKVDTDFSIDDYVLFDRDEERDMPIGIHILDSDNPSSFIENELLRLVEDD